MSGFLNISVDQALLKDLLDDWKNKKPKQLLSATKSMVRAGAYFFKTILKETTKSNKFGWFEKVGYSQTGTSMTGRVRANPPMSGAKGFKTGSKAPGGFLGKLSNVFRYAPLNNGMSAETGVLASVTSLKAFGWFNQFQEGAVTQVTPKMRGYFAAIGMPLRASTTTFTQKPRQLVGPEWEASSGAIGAIMAAKLTEKLGT